LVSDLFGSKAIEAFATDDDGRRMDVDEKPDAKRTRSHYDGDLSPTLAEQLSEASTAHAASDHASVSWIDVLGCSGRPRAARDQKPSPLGFGEGGEMMLSD